MARKKETDESFAYRVYMSDALKAAYKLNVRYSDIIIPDAPVDESSGEEIIKRITEKIEGMQNG